MRSRSGCDGVAASALPALQARPHGRGRCALAGSEGTGAGGQPCVSAATSAAAPRVGIPVRRQP
eukprot:13351660-Alexandrium_andersonii.AAC.1